MLYSLAVDWSSFVRLSYIPADQGSLLIDPHRRETSTDELRTEPERQEQTLWDPAKYRQSEHFELATRTGRESIGAALYCYEYSPKPTICPKS